MAFSAYYHGLASSRSAQGADPVEARGAIGSISSFVRGGRMATRSSIVACYLPKLSCQCKEGGLCGQLVIVHNANN
jgi:hypothetical protein